MKSEVKKGKSEKGEKGKRGEGKRRKAKGKSLIGSAFFAAAAELDPDLCGLLPDPRSTFQNRKRHALPLESMSVCFPALKIRREFVLER